VAEKIVSVSRDNVNLRLVISLADVEAPEASNSFRE
jgi:hypothetical protein